MRNLIFVIAFAATSTSIGSVTAQVYPSRPITMIAPTGAGSSTDAIGRIVSEHMRGSLGRPVIIENVAGASGTLGVGRVARAKPDGYTLAIGNWGTHVLNGPMFVLDYDLQKDFEPVALVSNDALVIVARKALPAKTLREFIAWLKANPGKASQGTTGAGGFSTVLGVFFQKETDTRVNFVPYRGGLASAMLDLVAGQIDFMIDTAADALPQVRTGAVNAFAVTSKSRLPAAPDIPTVDEAGLPGFYALNWQAIFAPKGTPADIVAKLNSAVVLALADATVERRLTTIGQELFPIEQQTPKALGALQKAEIEKWWPIIKAANIKGE
jgi:tripartite-type tricarboxylate transporter receptor subunit TctC